MNSISLNINDFFDLPSACIYNPDSLGSIEAVTIDSRHVPENALFIAVKGDRLDGHDFINDALKNRASAILIDEKKYRKYKEINVPVITVDDTMKSLGRLAGIWRNKLNTKVIGITGSAGKTSVKEYLAVLLNEKYKVNRTPANHNNHIGVPLTLLSTTNKHEYLVLELGTNHFGEIAYTSGIAKPDLSIITNIGSSHLEYLKNKKGVLKEKAALLNSTIENNGIIFINNDDNNLRTLYAEYPRRITYALESGADIQGNIDEYTTDGRAVVNLSYKKLKFKAELPVWGEQAAKNFVAAAAVALKTGLNRSEIISGAKKLKTYDKRFIVKKVKDFIAIDDTYNANPDSMRNAIAMLQKFYPGRTKIAVLGDMLELGTGSAELHKKLAGIIKKHKVDRVYTIGSMSENIYNSLKTGPAEAKHFISRSSLKRFLQRQKLKDTVVLFKGSRGMKMEEFLNAVQEKTND